ncbi:MAG: chromate transporter, partial [Caulobacteraceae bacterium]
LARTFGLISVVAVGGANATTPEIRHQVVDQLKWFDNATFSHLFAISQAAPGPNVMIVSLVGWRMAGLAGLLIATIAMLAPSSLLAYGVARFWSRSAGAPWVLKAQAAVAPIAVGLILASGVVLARTADHSAVTWIITGGVAALLVFTRRSPLWGLAAGAVIAIGAGRLGWPM